MKNYLFMIVMLAGIVSSCKTTEANYRRAYDKAVEGRGSADVVDSTIYGNVRRQMSETAVKLPSGKTVEVKVQHVKVTDGGGGVNENLKNYSLVVGQFKQRFNAMSLRERLVDAGHASAFVVETSEPYYFVVLSSFPSAAQASTALEEWNRNPTVGTKAPLPFILARPERR